MITIIFFAQTREIIGQSSLTLEFSSSLSDLENLRLELVSRGNSWDLALQRDKLLVAVNQEMSSWDTAVNDGDEIAFFPPVTGG